MDLQETGWGAWTLSGSEKGREAGSCECGNNIWVK